MVLLLPPTSNIITIDKFCKKQRREEAGLSKSATESISLDDHCELLVKSFISSFTALKQNCEPVALSFRAKLPYSQCSDTSCSRDAYGENIRCVFPYSTAFFLSNIYLHTIKWYKHLSPSYCLIKFEALITAPSRAGPLFLPSTLIFILHVRVLSHVQLFATPWTVARQAHLSVGQSTLPRQE